MSKTKFNLSEKEMDGDSKFNKTGNSFELLKQKNKEISTKLSDEINKVKDEMDNHFTNQKNENAKLQKEIANLKDQKKQLQDLLASLLKKISDLEIQVGMPVHLLENTV